MLVTNQLITQVYLAPEITNVLLTFDHLRWYRSSTGRNGFYEPATTAAAEPAALRSKPISRALTDTELLLRVNGATEVAVPFTGPDPVEVGDVAAAIATAAPGLLVVSVESGFLVIETVLSGSAAAIEVLASSAAPYLGLLVGETAIGTTADNTLVSGVSEYRFSDHQSSALTWYYVEYRNATSGLTSPRSITFRSRSLEGVPLNQLIGCYVRLCDLAGNPLGGRRVTVHNVFMPNKVVGDGKTWGVFRQYEEMVTDPNGYAEVLLIRGSTIDVTIGGTGFTRRIEVPTVGTIVDLLDPALDTRDEFGIQTPDIDFAIRTS
jgi:hypothetical protein